MGQQWVRFLARADVSRSGERRYDGEEGEDGADRRRSRLDGDVSPTKVSSNFARDSSVANSVAVRLSAFPLEPAKRGLPFKLQPSNMSNSFLPLGMALPLLTLFPQTFAPAVGSIFAPR